MEYVSVRFLHIVCAALWSGGGITMGLFVLPSMQEAGPAAGPVMRGVVARRFPLLMQVLGVITALTGIRLYMLRYSASWLTTPEGLLLSIGGLLGLGALAIGLMAQAPTAKKLGGLSASIAAQGSPPTADQLAQLGALQSKAVRLGKVLAWHLLGSLLLMTLSRIAQVGG